MFMTNVQEVRATSDGRSHWKVKGTAGVLDGTTRLKVKLAYNPPAGAIGHAIAALFGADPKRQMDDDLMRMKTLIETGNPPHDAAQTSPAGPGEAIIH